MKITSRTRQMSTNGVTLMSELSCLLSPACIARALRLRLSLQEEIDQLRAGIGHLDPEELDLRLEVIEAPDPDDGHADADAGGDERLGDAGGDRADAAAARRGHPLEGVDDAEHGAEQPDERRR